MREVLPVVSEAEADSVLVSLWTNVAGDMPTNAKDRARVRYVPKHAKNRLRSLILDNRKALSVSQLYLGLMGVIQHQIETGWK